MEIDTVKTKTKTASRKPHAVATRKDERVPSFAYSDRIPKIVAALARRKDKRATIADLFAVLKTGKTGQFGTERRVAATVRYDARNERILARDGAYVLLRTPKSQTRNGSVSRKRTRAVS